MKKAKAIIIIIIIVIAVFLIAHLLQKEKTFIDPQYTVATINKFTYKKRGGNSNLIYTIGEKEYKITGMHIESFVIEDKFTIMYENGRPDFAEILYYKPIFLDKEKTFNHYAKVISFMPIGSPSIKFSYDINGINYTRWQYLPTDYKKLFPELKKGKKYRIKALFENPQRSIIYLDKPQDSK